MAKRKGSGTSWKPHEKRIMDLLQVAGFVEYTHNQYLQLLSLREMTGDRSPLKCMIAQFPHPSIFRHQAKGDTVIINGERRILVESKYQDESGSTADKVCRIWCEFEESITPEWVVVFGGARWHKKRKNGDKPLAEAGAYQWLCRKAAATEGNQRQMHVFTDRNSKELAGWVRAEFCN